MDELIFIIAMIFIGLLAGISEATYRAMVIVALICIYYKIPRRGLSMKENEQKLLGRASDLVDRISKADYKINTRDRIFIRSVLLRLIEAILNKDAEVR